MHMAKAAVQIHTDAAMMDCPILDGSAMAQYAAALKSANALSASVLEFLARKTPKEQAAWLATSVQACRDVLQPWTMELLFVIGTRGRVRFTQLHDLLGLSSRTLSDKLKGLRETGLVDRELFDEQPIRIEYFLTKHGRRTAAAATPLFALLGHEALLASRAKAGPGRRANVGPAPRP